ncbi:hypothetical protein VPHD239_0100 [Vibrio phage D239]
MTLSSFSTYRPYMTARTIKICYTLVITLSV